MKWMLENIGVWRKSIVIGSVAIIIYHNWLIKNWIIEMMYILIYLTQWFLCSLNDRQALAGFIYVLVMTHTHTRFSRHMVITVSVGGVWLLHLLETYLSFFCFIFRVSLGQWPVRVSYSSAPADPAELFAQRDAEQRQTSRLICRWKSVERLRGPHVW